MRSRLVSRVFLFALLLASVAAAGDGDFFAVVRDAREAGALTDEEAILEVFRFVFDGGAVRADLGAAECAPLKCLTPMILEYEARRASLDPLTVREIDGYLGRARTPGKTASLTYDSPGGNFRLTYETSGVDAPPQADVDPANGVPDYVEWVAAYCDSSWRREIDDLGFRAPDLSGSKYMIYFEHMDAYGYTSPQGHGSSIIVIENDFASFPGNQDPEGVQKGAAKVTCAHEFKHASQMNTTGAMNMGGWVELDATWMEDVVYDLTNDYYNYLGSGSGISNPDQSLDYGGSGSYEDCIWQHYLCETWGVGMGLALMQRREAFPSETTTLSYDAIIAAQGADFRTAFTDHATWNYRCGIYADAGIVGYEEAAGYPTSSMWGVVESYPDSNAGSVSRMAAHFYQCKGMASIDHLRIRFTGQAGAEQRVVALLRRKAALGGGYFREDVPLDASNNGDYTVSMPGADLKQIGVLVINPKRIGNAASYTLVLESGTPSFVAAGAVPAPFALRPNEPNPFNPRTTIAFSLPERAATSLLVYDLAGRAVRTLLGGDMLSGGRHGVVWDGLDERGAEVASGVYLYRLESGNRSETRKMVLIR